MAHQGFGSVSGRRKQHIAYEFVLEMVVYNVESYYNLCYHMSALNPLYWSYRTITSDTHLCFLLRVKRTVFLKKGNSEYKET